MTLLKELIEAAEQAARDEVIAALYTSFFPGDIRAVPSTRGALERVVKAAVATAKEDAESAAIARFGPTVRAYKQQLEEAKRIISDLQHCDEDVYDQAFRRATKFLEAA